MKLTGSTLNIQFTCYQLFLNAIGTVVLWNVTDLLLRKLVTQGYKLVVIVRHGNCEAKSYHSWQQSTQLLSTLLLDGFYG